jgi:hypothetical protein
MAYNDTALLIVNELDASKRARFNAASITPGQTRVITIPDQDITLSAGSGATGTATLDFGAFPGSSDASIAVTGQTAITANSIVQAWLRPVDTADHLADEHLVETLRIEAGNIVAGTGFTIYGFNSNQLSEPIADKQTVYSYAHAGSGVLVRRVTPGITNKLGGRSTKIFGRWTVQWRWS